jgi:formate dehydrogenase (coenzyme F420) beta subunit
MNENLKNKVTELLNSGQIKGFLGLRSHEGHIGPHLFTAADELEYLVIGDWKSPGDSRYPLNKFLINIACKYPEDTFGVLVRGCDERGLKALYTWNQLNPNKVVAVGVACPQELADACECRKPYPDECVEDQKAAACEQKSVASIDALSNADRFALWIKEFTKCIKCYGCRDVCPMCFCNECSVGSDDLIHTGHIPPEMPIFHLTRAVHMIGRCIDCGLCNEACPADIPLRTLYKKVADIIDKEFQYRPGYSDQKSPLNVL